VTKKTRTLFSSKGQLVFPKAIRDAKGFSAGREVEFVDHPEGVLVKLSSQPKKYTLDDLLNALPPYKGPPITEQMMNDGMDEAMRERWQRKERNSRP
jgi:bifunctional DNA-binding transcriptional regulator/antitoxin component of YhaV-PrlF toxin-antitoxin module